MDHQLHPELASMLTNVAGISTHVFRIPRFQTADIRFITIGDAYPLNAYRYRRSRPSAGSTRGPGYCGRICRRISPDLARFGFSMIRRWQIGGITVVAESPHIMIGAQSFCVNLAIAFFDYAYAIGGLSELCRCASAPECSMTPSAPLQRRCHPPTKTRLCAMPDNNDDKRAKCA